MKPTKMIMIIWAIPFVVALLAVLLVCIAVASPVIGLTLLLHNWQENRIQKDVNRKRYELKLKKMS